MNFATKLVFLVMVAVSECCCGYDSRHDFSQNVPSHQIKPGQSIPAAVHTKHTIRYVNVDIPDVEHEPQIIEVAANPLPLIMHFKSESSRIRIEQSHTGAQPTRVEETKSEDQPHHLRHQVTKPIIQEVHEIIKPYRRVVQEIRPVVEEIETVVARKSGAHNSHDSAHNKETVTGGITGSVSFAENRLNEEQQRHNSGKRSTRWTNYARY